jgi:hypothetical protein
MILLLLFSLGFLLTFLCFPFIEFFIFEQTRLGVKIACAPVVLFFYFFQLGGFWLISLLATVASQKLQSSYCWVCNRSITLATFVAGAVAFCHIFVCNLLIAGVATIITQKLNYNHAEVVIVLVRRALIDSLLATAVLQKLQSPYFWSCNLSSRHSNTVFYVL